MSTNTLFDLTCIWLSQIACKISSNNFTEIDFKSVRLSSVFDESEIDVKKSYLKLRIRMSNDANLMLLALNSLAGTYE